MLAYFFIVVAPVLFAAAIYLCLTRLIALAGAYSSPVPPRIVFAFFLTCDVVTIVVQITGASLIGSREHNHRNSSSANNILIAGLAIQTATFGVFLVILLACVYRVRNWGSGFCQRGDYAEEVAERLPWLNCWLGTLLMAAVLVQIRTIFRLVESAQGVFGYLSSHEAFFGALEFVPVALAVPMLCWLGWVTSKAQLEGQAPAAAANSLQLHSRSADV